MKPPFRAYRADRSAAVTVDLVTRRDLALIAQIRAALADGSAKRSRRASAVRVAEIAAAVGVTPQAVSQWESGRRMPDAARALAYARALAAVTGVLPASST